MAYPESEIVQYLLQRARDKWAASGGGVPGGVPGSPIPAPFPEPSPYPSMPEPPPPGLGPGPTSLPPPLTDEPPSPLRARPTPKSGFIDNRDFGASKTNGVRDLLLPSHGAPSPNPNPLPASPSPSEPPISFAWGGRKPVPVNPNDPLHSVADLEGAPTADSFMGGRGTPGAGTLSVMNAPDPSLRSTDSIYDELERRQLERATEDPLWRERGAAKLWREQEMGARSDIQAAAESRLDKIEQMAMEQLRNSPQYKNPRLIDEKTGLPSDQPHPNPEQARREMEANVAAWKRRALLSLMGISEDEAGSMRAPTPASPRMPSGVFRGASR